MKFSIVTPAYNMERWIARTIESVISQEGNFSIEYIIVDDGSGDATARIAEKYEKQLRDKSYPIRCEGITIEITSRKKGGMYGAINDGFAQATGDIYAWINADDTYQPGAFQKMAAAFAVFPGIEWIKGITDTVDEQWQKIRSGACRIYRQDWTALGIYGQEAYFIEQDSCFWRTSLWKKAGPIAPQYQSAGDYRLWIQFARYAPLWPLKAPISNFMKREGQISKNVEKYKNEQLLARPKRSLTAWKARLFFTSWSRLGKNFEPLFVWLYPKFFMRGKFKNYEYLEIESGQAIKRQARSFIIGK